jgi:hypothetical protein
VINVLPTEYSVLVTLLGRRIGHKTNPLTIEELCSELNEEYDRIRDPKNSGRTTSTFEVDSNGEEHALYAGGKFKGRYRVCRVWGHKSATCPQKKGNNSGRSFGNGNTGTGSSSNGNSTGTPVNKKFTGVCHYCRKWDIVKKIVSRKSRMRLVVKRLLWQHQVMIIRRQR